MDNEQESALIELLQCIAAASVPLSERENAFRLLYDRTSARLYAVALRVVGNREWAEDVLQDAFLNIWRIADTYRDSLAPPIPWMALIVRSRGLDFLRRRKAERLQAQSLDEDGAEALPDPGEGPLELTQVSQRARALHECLRKLEARHREVLTLAYLRDLSHGELASQLRLPLGTVKTWIRRGIDQLRGCMARHA